MASGVRCVWVSVVVSVVIVDMCWLFFFFFFQAEDGIRDHCVTGVQTCALPISRRFPCGLQAAGSRPARLSGRRMRSEERREGKSVDLGGRRIIKKKKKKKKKCMNYIINN